MQQLATLWGMFLWATALRIVFKLILMDFFVKDR